MPSELLLREDELLPLRLEPLEEPDDALWLRSLEPDDALWLRSLEPDDALWPRSLELEDAFWLRSLLEELEPEPDDEPLDEALRPP
jgi:hypothetical protein